MSGGRDIIVITVFLLLFRLVIRFEVHALGHLWIRALNKDTGCEFYFVDLINHVLLVFHFY
jgi:hypothetical protein